MRSRRLLALENLEERVVLSTMFVNHLWASEPAGSIVEIDDSGGTAEIGANAFATIGEAIAMTGNDLDGDVIRIAPGTYNETFQIVNPNLELIGDGESAGDVIIDVGAGSTQYGVLVFDSASNVSLRGFSVVGETTNATLKYGIYVTGASDLQIDDVIVETTSSTGINLHGATDFSISNVTVTDTTGAGLFFTDVKDGTLSNITTSGNSWTGVGFSTYGRYYDIGISGIIISGNNSFGESATPNGGVMLEESNWDPATRTFDKENAHPISFSSNPDDGADVTFDFGDETPWLGYVLTGEQSETDGWEVRHNFYETLAQGLNAALHENPTHYTGDGVTLSPLAPTTGAPVLDGPSEINRGSAYTLELTPSAAAGVPTQWAIDWGDGAINLIDGSATEATHDYANAPGNYTISVREIADDVYESGASTLAVSVINVNPTIAITGAPDESVARGAEIDLGSDAGGPDVDNLTYSWVVTLGEEDLDTGSGDEFSFIPNLPGVYTVTLTVTGLFGAEAQDSVTINVFNAKPTVTIEGAPEGLIPRNQGVELTANGSDGDGDALTYAWTVTLNGDEFAAGSGEEFAFTPTLPGEYHVSVIANDGYEDSDPATATISVFNAAPTVVIANAPTDPVARNQAVTLIAEGDDGNGDALTYAWTVSFNGDEFAAGSGEEFAFTPTLPGEYLVSVIANDGYDDSAPATATIVAANANPTVAITGAPNSLNQGQAATLGSTASDPDGDALNYAWTVRRGGTVVVTGDATSLYFAQSVPGDYLVTLTVTDPHGGSATATATIAVVGVAPTVTITGAPDSVNQGESVHLASEVDNPAGGDLTHAWTVTRDGEVVLTSDGQALNFTPVVPGNYLVTLTVTNVDGASGTTSRAIGVVNVAPHVVIAPLPESPIMSGDVVNLAATATDPNPDATLSYTWTITRNGVFMGQANQPSLHYVPLFSGLYEATLVVSDGEGGVTTRSVQFEVQTNIPPAAEHSLEVLQQRVDIQVERQQQRIDYMSDRFGPTPPPFAQRMINRMVQTQIRMQSLVARRMMMLQRFFGMRGFR